MELACEAGREHVEYDCLAELREWFLVSGDTDDFIFYGEPEANHSEK